MSNEIKIDKSMYLGALMTQPAKVQQPEIKMNQESVSVSDHLSKLASLLSEDKTRGQAEVTAARQQVEAGLYKVDVDALADKLLKII
jgi:anti-sigma28 factor (negative regulator of flagellin synthesis)